MSAPEREADVPFEPAELRALWNFADPEGSRERFAEMRASLPGDSVRAAELTTQMARAAGLAGAFTDGHALLDELDAGGANPVVTRIALERGRLLNSSGQAVEAIPQFVAAVEAGRFARRDDLVADALHMLAIADEAREADWHAQGVTLASSSADPAVRRWLGPVHNNHGWTLHERGAHAEALEAFSLARDAYGETGDAESIRVADWTFARGLRSLGRNAEALAIQRRLKAEGPVDRYVDEELAILEGDQPG